MRSGVARAGQLMVFLASLPERPGGITGKAATELTQEHLLRVDGRMRRMRFSASESMSLSELVKNSTKRARARQGKPGKR